MHLFFSIARFQSSGHKVRYHQISKITRSFACWVIRQIYPDKSY